MRKVKIPAEIGDIIAIPLKDGRTAYAQYVYFDGKDASGMGCLIQVFDIITSKPISLDRLESASLMFPPVFVGLKTGIQSKRWKVIGSLPIENFVFPKFRSTFGTGPGTYHDWKIWDGITTFFVGDLPPEYRLLELKSVWGAEALEERIARGGSYRGESMH
jgi:Immunity protein 26